MFLKKRFLSILAISLLTVALNAIQIVQAESAPPTSSTNPTPGVSAPPTSAVPDPDTTRANGNVPAGQPTINEFKGGLLFNVQCIKKEGKDAGKCSMCDIVQVGVNVGNFILAIAGAVALFFGAWAAFGFIVARGDDEKIKEARTTMWNALAGIILVLLAWQLVAVILTVLTGNANPFQNVCGIGNVGQQTTTGSRHIQNE
ncbi:hypothetical protein HZA86_02590 [Candidatus Uhrbacteria bacterium]|nr:hypothetical protein [Candidatus Uhrbacteria bacterium]